MYIEYDNDKKSIVNPKYKKIENIPKIAITCFSDRIILPLLEEYNGKPFIKISKTKIYNITYKGVEFLIYKSPVGSPACVMIYEDLISLGIEKLILFGSVGVLNDIKEMEIIIPTSAIRDEGTSYHYIKPSNEIKVNQKYKNIFKKVLKDYNFSFVEGKTWTTDACYRETSNSIQRAIKNGCICVEMECSAMNAVAKFRKKNIFTFFYAADKINNNKWDKRCLGGEKMLDKKKTLAILALELAIKII